MTGAEGGTHYQDKYPQKFRQELLKDVPPQAKSLLHLPLAVCFHFFFLLCVSVRADQAASSTEDGVRDRLSAQVAASHSARSDRRAASGSTQPFLCVATRGLPEEARKGPASRQPRKHTPPQAEFECKQTQIRWEKIGLMSIFYRALKCTKTAVIK